MCDERVAKYAMARELAEPYYVGMCLFFASYSYVAGPRLCLRIGGTNTPLRARFCARDPDEDEGRRRQSEEGPSPSLLSSSEVQQSRSPPLSPRAPLAAEGPGVLALALLPLPLPLPLAVVRRRRRD